MKLLATSLVLLVAIATAWAQPREYPYPNEPQYQYPMQSNRAKAMKCPRGQAPFQGKCRIIRPVY